MGRFVFLNLYIVVVGGVPTRGVACPDTWEDVSKHVGGRVQIRGRTCPDTLVDVSRHVIGCVQTG